MFLNSWFWNPLCNILLRTISRYFSFWCAHGGYRVIRFLRSESVRTFMLVKICIFEGSGSICEGVLSWPFGEISYQRFSMNWLYTRFCLTYEWSNSCQFSLTWFRLSDFINHLYLMEWRKVILMLKLFVVKSKFIDC